MFLRFSPTLLRNPPGENASDLLEVLDENLSLFVIDRLGLYFTWGYPFYYEIIVILPSEFISYLP